MKKKDALLSAPNVHEGRIGRGGGGLLNFSSRASKRESGRERGEKGGGVVGAVEVVTLSN